MTPRERVLRALRGEKVDKTPFTVYETLLPWSSTERKLRNQGLCIVWRKTGLVKTYTPDVRIKEIRYEEGGRKYVRVEYETPVGNFYSLQEDRGYAWWTLHHIFSSPEDYRKLIFYYQSQRYEPDFEEFIRMDKLLGEDFVLRGGIGLEPFQQIIRFMGTETFCIEWMERRDEVLKLYEAIREARRKLYPLLAESPCLFFNYGGNFTVEVEGPEVFRKYYLPNYEEAGECLHKKGKLLGTHLDANCKLIAEYVRESPLDYIEAFTPYPDTDMTLKEALEEWKGKTIWINFPSSVHLLNKEKIREVTLEFLEETKDYPGFLIGITEDVPEDRWEESFQTISETINRFYS